MDVILRQLGEEESGQGQSYRLNEGATLVGRSDNCTLVLSAGSVSRWHCILDVGAEGVCVTDLHSLNGTYINEQRIIRGELNSEDRLRIGQVSFKVEIECADQESVPAGSLALRALPPEEAESVTALVTTDFASIRAQSVPRRRRPSTGEFGNFEKLSEIPKGSVAANTQLVRYEEALRDCSAQLRQLIEKVAALEAKLDNSLANDGGDGGQLAPSKAFERHDALMYVARAAVCDRVRQKNLPYKSA